MAGFGAAPSWRGVPASTPAAEDPAGRHASNLRIGRRGSGWRQRRNRNVPLISILPYRILQSSEQKWASAGIIVHLGPSCHPDGTSETLACLSGTILHRHH
jgi:hypothetical protein